MGFGKRIFQTPPVYINAMKKKEQLKIVLSQDAIQYIYKHGDPVANYQFIGYLFPLKKDVGGVLGIDGSWGICSWGLDKKGNLKPLTEKKVNKIIKWMLKIGMLVRAEDSPFEEFEYYNNIKMDFSKIKYLDEKLFDNLGD